MSPDLTNFFHNSLTDLECLFSEVLMKSSFVKFKILVSDLNLSDNSSQNILGSLLFFLLLFEFFDHVHLCQSKIKL